MIKMMMFQRPGFMLCLFLLMTFHFSIDELTFAKSQQDTLPPEYQPVRMNVLAWPRMGASEMGCLFEKQLKAKNPLFNGQKLPRKTQGDPCHDPTAYYAGPEFPAKKGYWLHPLITQVGIFYEGDRVQSVTLHFKHPMPISTLKRIVQIPQNPEQLPENVMTVDYQQGGQHTRSGYANTVALFGFEHQGAGDVDCPAEALPKDLK